MKDLTTRKYYKIFTGTEQQNGFENIFLGYEARTTEQILNKDDHTVFHFPYFAATTPISSSGLIEDGATAGPIPALADRVYSNRMGYGNETPYGVTSYPETGEWLCTWLYSASGESPVWLDRYYRPGHIALEQHVIGDYVNVGYAIDEESVFKDVVSDKCFESGVMYRYYHIGEKTASTLIDTLSGSFGDKGIRLHYTDWKKDSQDLSGYNNALNISNFSSKTVASRAFVGEVDRNFLDFNNTDYTEYNINFNTSYLNEREFTTMCWIRAEDWDDVASSQIVGNLFDGGFQISYNDTKFTPYFFVSDAFYNNLFCFNNNIHNYTTVNLYTDTGINATCITMDRNKDLIVADSVKKQIKKIDHNGAQKNLILNLSSFGVNINELIPITEIYNIFVDGDNNYWVTCKECIVQVNDELLSPVFHKRYCDKNTHILFTSSNERYINDGDIAAIFDDQDNMWAVDARGRLRIGTVPFDTINKFFKNKICTNIAIDPSGRVWVLHDQNKITIVNKNYTVVSTAEVGEFNEEINTLSSLCARYLSFVYRRRKQDNKLVYIPVLVSTLDRSVFELNSVGELVDVTYLPYRTTNTAIDSRANLQISTLGDFTGYNWDRVFNTKKTLQVNVSLRNINTSGFKKMYINLARELLYNNQWHHVCIILKDDVFNVYLDGKLRETLNIEPNYFINFDSCNSIFVGTSNGKKKSLNSEVLCNNIYYNGFFDDFRVYNYAILPHMLMLFRRAYFRANSLTWNIPTSTIQYIEGVDRFFQNKIPGAQSNFYKIRIKNLMNNIPDNIKMLIEDYIRNAVSETQPAYTELLSIEWD